MSGSSFGEISGYSQQQSTRCEPILPHFSEPPDTRGRFICINCKQLLHYKRPIVQLHCGHRMSQECLTFIKQGGFQLTCPGKDDLCRSFDLSQLGYVIKDIAAAKQLGQKKVYCEFHENGCREVVKWCCLQTHVKNCIYRHVINIPGPCDVALTRFESSKIIQALKQCFDVIVPLIQLEKLVANLQVCHVLTDDESKQLLRDKDLSGQRRIQELLDIMILDKDEAELNHLLLVLEKIETSVSDKLRETMSDPFSLGSSTSDNPLKELCRCLRHKYAKGSGQLEPPPLATYPVEWTISGKNYKYDEVCRDNGLLEYIEKMLKTTGSRQIHISGDAGMGKSTFLSMLVYEWIEKSYVGDTDAFDLVIPLSGRCFHHGEPLLMSMARAIQGEKDFGKEMLSNLEGILNVSSILVVIDDVDEIVNLEKNVVVADFIQGKMMPEIKVLCASRQRCKVGTNIELFMEGLSRENVLSCLLKELQPIKASQDKTFMMSNCEEMAEKEWLRTPLNLSLLTSVIKRLIELQIFTSNVCLPASETEVYSKYILQQLIQQEDLDQCKEALIKPLQNPVIRGNGVPPKVRSIIFCLGKLSYDSFKTGSSTFSADMFDDYFMDFSKFSQCGLFSLSSKDANHDMLTFTHKTMQEFVAGMYLTHVRLEDKFLSKMVSGISSKQNAKEKKFPSLAVFGRHASIMKFAFDLSPDLQYEICTQICANSGIQYMIKLIKDLGSFTKQQIPFPTFLNEENQTTINKIKNVMSFDFTPEYVQLKKKNDRLSTIHHDCCHTYSSLHSWSDIAKVTATMLKTKLVSEVIFNHHSSQLSREALEGYSDEYIELMRINERDVHLWISGTTDILDLLDFNGSKPRKDEHSKTQTYGFYIIQQLLVTTMMSYSTTLPAFCMKDFLCGICDVWSSRHFLENRLNQSSVTIFKHLSSHFLSCITQKVSELHQGAEQKLKSITL